MDKKIITIMVVLALLTGGLAIAANMESGKYELAQGHMMHGRGRGNGHGQMMGRQRRGRGMGTGMQMGKGFHNPMMLMNPKVVEKIGITEQQQEEIKTICKNYEMKKIDEWADMRKMMLEEKMNMKFQLDPDVAEYRSKMEKMSNMMIDMKVAQLQAFKKALNALTPEQKTALENMYMEYQNDMMKRMHRRGPMGGYDNDNNDEDMATDIF
ncbi:MAG: Spy/CpxP family protein refolding chaperone [Vulcanimicrobiota bacterium]